MHDHDQKREHLAETLWAAFYDVDADDNRFGVVRGEERERWLRTAGEVLLALGTVAGAAAVAMGKECMEACEAEEKRHLAKCRGVRRKNEPHVFAAQAALHCSAAIRALVEVLEEGREETTSDNEG